MNATALLTLAAGVPDVQVDKMAHALGWPSSYSLGRGGRLCRVKWADPYRNHYAGTSEDPDWRAAEDRGLARVIAFPGPSYPYTSWAVTDLGRQVVRLRLEATRRAFVASRPAKARTAPT